MTRPPLSLDPEYCRLRQQRVVRVLQSRSISRALFTSTENVQYLTGFRPHRLMTSAAVLDADGTCTLCAPNTEPDGVAADRIVTYEAQRHATLRQDQQQACWEKLGDAHSKPRDGRIGVEASSSNLHLRRAFGVDDADRTIDLEPELLKLRRAKDPDELAMIRRAVECTTAMYEAAKEMIEPGVTEIEVFNRLHAAAVDAAGEPLTALGNDYQCNSPGGPPRQRPAEAGELFILDLGPSYRGYYADNCRTFSVGRRPTDEQLQAWDQIVSVLETVETSVRPGVSARAVFTTARQMLDAYRSGWFCHHLGHGFGLFPHEAPHLNPHWDDVFQEGDVFTAEPGLYDPQLRAGIRLEQNYRVTAEGVERLTSFPLELSS